MTHHMNVFESGGEVASPHVVIVGGGCGGFSAARSLRNTQVRVKTS